MPCMILKRSSVLTAVAGGMNGIGGCIGVGGGCGNGFCIVSVAGSASVSVADSAAQELFVLGSVGSDLALAVLTLLRR